MVRIRIIPSTITVAVLLLCVKVMDLTHNTDAFAQADAEHPPASAETAGDKAAAHPAVEGHAPKEEGKSEKSAEENKAVTKGPGTTVDRRYTPVEVELLQNLAQRRDELDRWERNVLIKESTLSATEKRIDDKITQVQAMKKEVAALLSQYNEKEDTKIRSLVKIYESMKPKDAARIFDEVEMPILLLVIDKMSEKKVAPVLAFMDSRKAKSITVQLAEQRRINNKIVSPVAAAP